MRVVFLVFAVIACGAWGRVSERYDFSADSENAVVLYESIPDVDLILRRVDLGERRSVGRAIMLPAIHRVNASRISNSGDGLGFKELEPGFYAIVDAYSSMSAQIGAGGFNAGCRDQDALVFEVRAGEMRLLPRSFYQLTDQRQNRRDGVGEEQAGLEQANAIVGAYPNIRVDVQLLAPTARVRFAQRTSRDIFRESCASGQTFETFPPDGPRQKADRHS